MISNVSNHTVVTLMSRGLAVLHSEDTSDYTGEYCISTVVFSTLMGQQKKMISLEILDVYVGVSECVCVSASAGSRLRGARGIYYPRGPFAADLQHLPLQRVQEKQWGEKIN